MATEQMITERLRRLYAGHVEEARRRVGEATTPEERDRARQRLAGALDAQIEFEMNVKAARDDDRNDG